MLGRYSEAKIYIDQALQNLDESIDNSVIQEHAEKIKQKANQ
jgi:phage gp46-like protein